MVISGKGTSKSVTGDRLSSAQLRVAVGKQYRSSFR